MGSFLFRVVKFFYFIKGWSMTYINLKFNFFKKIFKKKKFQVRVVT